jgi:antirestriction protein
LLLTDIIFIYPPRENNSLVDVASPFFIGETTMIYLQPEICVVCLAACHAGHPHGVWIDADQDEDSLMAEIQTMLESSPIANAEKWEVQDFSDFGGLDLSGQTDLATISDIAMFLVKHNGLGVELLNYFDLNLEEAKRMMEENYHGVYDSEVSFVREFLQEHDRVPESLACYIDYELMARDWFTDGFVSFTVDGQVHVFCQY